MDSDNISENSIVPVMTESSEERHVAVLAFPFASHPRTLLNLVYKAARAAPNLQFSFFSTEKSNNKLFSSASKANLPLNIKACNVADGIPEDDHPFSGNLQEELELFVKATPDNFRSAIEATVAETGTPICCLLTDAFLTFAGEMAEDLHIPWVTLWVASPHCLSAHIYTDLICQFYNNSCRFGGVDSATDDNGNGVSKPEDQTLDLPGLSVLRKADLREQLVLGSDSPPLFYRMLHKLINLIPGVSAILLISYEEITDPLITTDLKSKFPRLLYLGFLSLSLPPPPLPPSDSDSTGCLPWLDSQNAMSVAYISFGTAAKLPGNEVVALAEALEESGIPFLWSLGDETNSLLPEGFVEKTGMQGKVVPWAPQTQVLSHPSTFVYITHCGYQSMFESVAGGVPLICRPFWGEQFMNATMAQDVWGIGLRVEGDVLTKSGLLECFEIILEHERGREMREKIKSLKEVAVEAAAPNGAAAKDFETFVELIYGH
ncbi:anthocyanidin 3-O-glucosyltransferase 7-like [Tripterygium wilfordii]|uniref:Glycosyltransferase n=1 Tax=Tripterygium wilfordii TaxID=458696 RepID=A0A7J7DQG5_TRIWF|nr:anthocyanidin 3-O-glucosyltransferase UFGT-like [Tripterygium wilfordii]KAF5748557.1 anthocyanidin 3-O-glucosyltransferase 7-like [Tripterygium wilfordii]